ncbi:hypothetical protein [Janibacter massiliensis]|uniref:hypothetical protein n=1 Tax=Janibacter massiliensis TaxID=2058291 RepID=UPI000D10EFCE|nr:hypothetical protein [Janibacter massiliensis]
MRNPFRRRSRIDGAAREALRSAGAGRVVAWATDGSGGVVVATVAELAVVDAGGAISLTPWHEVLSGRWVADEDALVVTTVDGQQRMLAVDEDSGLLEALRERVQTSVVTSESLARGRTFVAIRQDLTTRALLEQVVRSGRLVPEDRRSPEEQEMLATLRERIGAPA